MKGAKSDEVELMRVRLVPLYAEETRAQRLVLSKEESQN